jgi:hypothetical protein
MGSPIGGRKPDTVQTMMNEINPAVTREEEAARLEALILARAADMIMGRATTEINGRLERLGVAYRVPANYAQLTNAVVDLAYAHNEAYKRDVCMLLPDDGGAWISNATDKVLMGQPAISSPRMFQRNEAIDLTGWLGEGGGVRVSKSVRDGAGGCTLTFADKPYTNQNGTSSLYYLFEPQDMLELRFRHNKPRAQNAPDGH